VRSRPIALHALQSTHTSVRFFDLQSFGRGSQFAHKKRKNDKLPAATLIQALVTERGSNSRLH
jgi:hypothetical protein